jgi:hypothetical protein
MQQLNEVSWRKNKNIVMATRTVVPGVKFVLKMCFVILPCTLLLGAYFTGVFSTSTHNKMAQVVDESSNLIKLKPSTKYAASGLEGMDRNANAKVISGSVLQQLVDTAMAHPRKRKMTDLTKVPEENSMQTLINTWTEGSFSPIHMHEQYSEVCAVLLKVSHVFSFFQLSLLSAELYLPVPVLGIDKTIGFCCSERGFSFFHIQ